MGAPPRLAAAVAHCYCSSRSVVRAAPRASPRPAPLLHLGQRYQLTLGQQQQQQRNQQPRSSSVAARALPELLSGLATFPGWAAAAVLAIGLVAGLALSKLASSYLERQAASDPMLTALENAEASGPCPAARCHGHARCSRCRHHVDMMLHAAGCRCRRCAPLLLVMHAAAAPWQGRGAAAAGREAAAAGGSLSAHAVHKGSEQKRHPVHGGLDAGQQGGQHAVAARLH